MAGYAASARIEGAQPQFAFASEHAFRSSRSSPGAISTGRDDGAIEELDLVGRPIGETAAEWLASVGETWSQLTFFLFDPESWR